MGVLHRLYQEFTERVAFAVVYIKEAHPEDGWVLVENREEGIAISDPRSSAERREAARACALRMDLAMPVVIDGPENLAASAYGGWPDRLYLIGTDGTVVFQGAEGPFGFRPEVLEQSIRHELARERSG